MPTRLCLPALITFACWPIVALGAPGDPEWFMRVYLPVGYNSNPLEDFTAASFTTPASLELDPELQLGHVHTLSRLPLTLSARAGAEHDSFPNSDGASYGRAYTALRVTYETGADDQEYQPFLSYTPSLLFTRGYATLTSTSHNLLAGVDKMFNFGADWRRLPPQADSESDAVYSLGFTARVQQRLRDPSPASVALIAGPWATWCINDNWSATLEVDAVGRWYRADAGLREHSWLVNPQFTLAWTPGADRFGGSARRRALGKPEIDLQISYARLDSNVPGNSFRQWQVGPTLLARWWF